jgi:UTP--glucose-1-phosphate uridylyltransferase
MTRTITKAIIPAAGLGTRLLPATKSQPKEMLPVGRKPAMQYVVEELQSAGLKQILIITGRRKQAIEDHFDADPVLLAALKEAGNEAMLAELSYIQRGSRFFYTRQSSPKGLGHAVGLGAEFADGDDCVVALGDSLVASKEPSAPLRAIAQAHVELGAAAIVAVEEVPPDETHRYGIVIVDRDDMPPGEPVRMADIVEKPARGTVSSRLAVAARYAFSPAIFEALSRTAPDSRGEIQLTNAIKLLIQMGLPVYAWLFRPDERRYDIGNFESYFRTFVDFALADERYGYLARQYLKAKAYEF